MVAHIYNSCAGKAEASGFMGLAGQLASHTLEKRAPGQGEAQSQMRNSISGHLWPEHIPRRGHAHPHTCVLDTHAHIPLCLKKQAFGSSLSVDVVTWRMTEVRMSWNDTKQERGWDWYAESLPCAEAAWPPETATRCLSFYVVGGCFMWYPLMEHRTPLNSAQIP